MSIFKYLLGSCRQNRQQSSLLPGNPLSHGHTLYQRPCCHAHFHCLQNKPLLATGGVGLIGKPPLVLSLHKQAAVWVCYALRHRSSFFFFLQASFFRYCLWTSLLEPVTRHHRQGASFHGSPGLHLSLPSVSWHSAWMPPKFGHSLAFGIVVDFDLRAVYKCRHNLPPLSAVGMVIPDAAAVPF